MTICFNWIVDLNAYLKTIIVVSVLIFMIYEINTITTSTTTKAYGVQQAGDCLKFPSLLREKWLRSIAAKAFMGGLNTLYKIPI